MEKQTKLSGTEPLQKSKKKEVEETIKRLTYSQDWPAYNLAQTQEKIIAEKLLFQLLTSFQEKRPIGKPGRDKNPLHERIYAMFAYNYSGDSARRCISDLKMAKERKVINHVPHFNSVLNYFYDVDITPLLKRLIQITSLPLRNVETDFAVDSSGFTTSIFERWLNARTDRVEKKRHWKKCHLMIGVKSNVITSVDITEGVEADSPHLIPLALETRRFFNMKEVSADKAYLSRGNLNAIAELGAIPYVPFKSNSRRSSHGSIIWSRMFDYFLNNKEKFLRAYHKRSNVETAFSMIKKKFGLNLRTKRGYSQVNEILMKCLCHNLAVLVQESFELGLKIDLDSCAKMVNAQK